MSRADADDNTSQQKAVEFLFDLHVEEETYFPTQVFTYQLPEQSTENLTGLLLDAVYKERDQDLDGIERSNIRELGGWHSRNNLHREEPYKPLVDLVNAVGQKISRKNGYHEAYALEVNSMWSIINPPGCSNRAHIHPESLWSGVFYVQAPEGSGDFEFIDPRTANLMNTPKFRDDKGRPQNCWAEVFYTPKPGKCILFPSWLYHSVSPNLSAEQGDAGNRIIMSFNLDQVKRSA
ncbi:MAG: TIGR02466 family protein [Aquisalinus sp.]|nr:TIGR02466 family protein [Aquisalinus sp.]